jgi:hypothetical protein
MAIHSDNAKIIAQACRNIANSCADASGFIPVRSLLNRFHADVDVRPLLVEAMIAIRDSYNGAGGQKSEWTVLLDKEMYGDVIDGLGGEEWHNPLPSRFRNTVAHELAHSLAFRSAEFGISLKSAPREGNNESYVRDVEAEIEKLTPVLLWAPKPLAEFLQAATRSVSVIDLVEVRKKLGLSREVLVNRLRILQSTGEQDLLSTIALTDVAIGMVEWKRGGVGAIRGWPLFRNFSNGLHPAFVHQAQGQNLLPAESVTANLNFALLGGEEWSTTVQMPFGTMAKPDAKNAYVEFSIEGSSRVSGTASLFVARVV